MNALCVLQLRLTMTGRQASQGSTDDSYGIWNVELAGPPPPPKKGTPPPASSSSTLAQLQLWLASTARAAMMQVWVGWTV
jgi:hypothetical protein